MALAMWTASLTTAWLRSPVQFVVTSRGTVEEPFREVLESWVVLLDLVSTFTKTDSAITSSRVIETTTITSPLIPPPHTAIASQNKLVLRGRVGCHIALFPFLLCH